MPFIGTTPTQGFVSSFPKQSFTPNGSTTVFTLTNPVATANDLEVFVGNVRQEPTTAYTAAGTTLTMSEAPATGLNFYVINKSQAQVTTTPPANSISTDKIINANVTSAKLASTLDLSGTGRTGHGGLKSITVYADAGTHTYTKPTGINTVKVFDARLSVLASSVASIAPDAIFACVTASFKILSVVIEFIGGVVVTCA